MTLNMESGTEESERHSNSVLEARGVVVRFGGVVALDDVSLRAEAGWITGVLGPNGAGKTTLFAVMSGLLRPHRGRVALGGHDVSRLGPHRRARLGIARTFQRVELFAPLSVRDHLILAHRLRRRYGRERRDRHAEASAVESLLDGLGLTEVADVDASTLPLGTARMVEVGRALASRPRILFLDEPSSGLDSDQQQRLIDVLKSARRDRELSMVLVEHNVEMVLGVSDFVYVLDQGRTIAAATPHEVARDPAVHSAYLGADYAASLESP